MISGFELEEFRRDAEAAMVDRFDVYAPNGTAPGVNGMRAPVYSVVAVGVPGKITDPQPTTVTVGEVDRQVMNASLHCPVSSIGPAVGFEYLCTAVGAVSDPTLLGKRWRVTPAHTPAKTYATARRFEVQEVPL